MSRIRTNLLRLRRGLCSRRRSSSRGCGGGEWTEFSWTVTESSPQDLDGGDLVVHGWLGGFEVESWRLSDWLTVFPADFNVDHYRWMWTPLFERLSSGAWSLHVPYWIPTLVLVASAAVLFRLDRRSLQWKKDGCCVACGYCLVGLGANVPCPECGGEVDSRK